MQHSVACSSCKLATAAALLGGPVVALQMKVLDEMKVPFTIPQQSQGPTSKQLKSDALLLRCRQGSGHP